MSWVRSLHQKKYRLLEGAFVAEGVKVVREWLDQGHHPMLLVATEALMPVFSEAQPLSISEKDLSKISALTTAQGCLAVFRTPDAPIPTSSGFIVALDHISDPGNMGTLIRLADWFGVHQIWCSAQCVDVFNPKVVQASMGSLARVPVCVVDLAEMLYTTHLPVYGAFLQGENVYEASLPPQGILVLGNEANGITPQVEAAITHRVHIPQFSQHQKTESLNVATAGAILLSEWKRRLHPSTPK